MDFTQLLQLLQATLGNSLPRILGAVALLVLGWLAAVVVRWVIRKALSYTKLDERLSEKIGGDFDLARAVGTGAFYLILVMAFVAFFNALELQIVSEPLGALVEKVLAFVPQLVAGGVLLLVAWIIATIVKKVVTVALGATKLDEKLTSEAGAKPPSESLGNVLYWLVLLLFLPAILGALKMEGLLAPVQDMVSRILAIVPNVIAAAIIAFVGWFVAKILRDLVSNLLGAAGADKVGEKVGLSGTMGLSKLVGLLVYIFLLVPALIAALNALQVEAISAPATEMLGTVMNAIPHVLAAAVILALAWFVARFVAELISNLLGGLGFDGLPSKLGLAGAFPEDAATPSQLVGKVIIFFAMLFAVVEAAGRIGFGQVSEMVAMFVRFGGNVLQGVVIIAVGFWLSNLAHAAVLRVSGKSSKSAAGLVRFAILGLVFAMGLRAMGLADDIINMAFGLTLGSVAVAVALSFGLGGREAAGRQMEHWMKQLRGGKA